jgi:glycosyltransferase involved in cell wall biosynthesis
MENSSGDRADREPTVGLGMPVYNGERYVREAIRSVLAQTLDDFELVISDNASSDGTEAICRAFAAEDPRVRYFRNETNVGAHPNFNVSFNRSRGKYFKWIAHDDLLYPRYLEECVAVLDSNPDAVQCQADLEFIDGEGESIGVVPWRLAGGASSDPVRRFATVLLERHNCYDFMGLFRRDALAQAPLQSFHGGDRALLAHMATLGQFSHVYKPLMTVRDHANRYTRSKLRPTDRASWTDSRKAGRLSFPHWSLYGSYWKMAWSMPSGFADKLRASGVLLAWWFFNWNGVRMAVDVAATVAPNLVGYAEHFKQTYISPAPGVDEIRRKTTN